MNEIKYCRFAFSSLPLDSSYILNYYKNMQICSNLGLTNLSIEKKKPFSPYFTLKKVSFPSSRNPSIKFKRNFVIAQIPAMQQKITILNRRGEKLVGVLHETGSTNIVVLCHGFRSSKDNNTMVNLAAALENEGISAFRFDFSGNGESEGAFHYGNYSSEAEDLRTVIEYFAGVSRSTAVVLGHSKENQDISIWLSTFEGNEYSGPVSGVLLEGGNVVLLYASKYHDIGAVVNVSGRYDLKRGIEERLGEKFLERLKKDGYIAVKTRTGDYQVTEESLMERLNTNMHEACLSIDGRCRVLTVHGSADEIIPVEDALEFAKIIPNHQLQIIEGADHRYSSHQDELASAVLRFTKECLQQEGEDVPK